MFFERLEEMTQEELNEYTEDLFSDIIQRVQETGRTGLFQLFMAMSQEEQLLFNSCLIHSIKERFRPYIFNIIRAAIGLPVVDPSEFTQEHLREIAERLQALGGTE